MHGFAKIEANDSLTLLRRSKMQMTAEVKPTKFASLLATEILATLQNVLVKAEDIIIQVKSDDAVPPSGTSSETNEKKTSVGEENKSKDLYDLHVTPLAKILVEQAVVTIAEKLGITIPLKRQTSDTSQHNIPLKKNIGNIKSLKEIDLKTPATILTLAVLEAAAKQTGTPFDKSLHCQKQEAQTYKKFSQTKKTSLESAASTYGAASKRSGHGRVKTVSSYGNRMMPNAVSGNFSPAAEKTFNKLSTPTSRVQNWQSKGGVSKSMCGSNAVGSREFSKPNAGYISKSKPSQQESVIEKKSEELTRKRDKQLLPGPGALSEIFHVDKELTGSLMRLGTDNRSVSSPQLTGDHAGCTTQHVQETDVRDEESGMENETLNETHVNVNNEDKALKRQRDHVESHDTDKICEGTTKDAENIKKTEPEQSELPEKRSSFFSRVSSFLLSKRGFIKSDRSSSSDQEGTAILMEEVGRGFDKTVDDNAADTSTGEKDIPTTPLMPSKSEENKSKIMKIADEELSNRISSPQLTSSAKIQKDSTAKQKAVQIRSSQVINQIVRDQINRIMYNSQIAYAKEMGVEIRCEDRKVISDTKVIGKIVCQQLSQVLQEGQMDDLDQKKAVKQDSEKFSDKQIIESIVNEEICKVMLGLNLKPDKIGRAADEGIVLRQSTTAFAAIANAYASEMNVNNDLGPQIEDEKDEHEISSEERETSQTQHPIHLAILKKIASKIKKEQEIRTRKVYSNDMPSILKLDLDDRVSVAFLQTVAERYTLSTRQNPEKCRNVTDAEEVLKLNMITAITLIREGVMPNSELTDLVSAVVASYLIAHSMLPLAEDTCLEHTSFSQYKGMEVGEGLTTPILIDILIAEILDNVKQHLQVGTFNAVHIIMAVYEMHRNSIEVVEKKKADAALARQPPATFVEFGSEDEESTAVDEAAEEDVDFVPMYGDHPLGLSKEEASSALVALSVKNPGQIDSGTDAAERNSFLSLVKPDVSKLQTISHANDTVTEESARRHLSAVSLQFKKRSEPKFSLAVHAPMKGVMNYEKLRRGSMPVMGSRKEADHLSEGSDGEDVEDEEDRNKCRLRSRSIAIGMQKDEVTNINDPALFTSGIGTRYDSGRTPGKKTSSNLTLQRKKPYKTTTSSPTSSLTTISKSSIMKVSQKSKSGSLHEVSASDESVIRSAKNHEHPGSSIGSKSSARSSQLIRIFGGSQVLIYSFCYLGI